MKRFFRSFFILALLALAGCSRKASHPIGIFDSGTGGLTVLEKFLEMDEYAHERFVYLADQANMPYGNYDAVGKADFLRELVVHDAEFLAGERYYKDAAEAGPTGRKAPCKIIVIACNTATAYGLETLRTRFEGTGIRIVGVINAGVKATLDLLADGKEPYAIGVLATPGTISSGAYERTIKTLAAERRITALAGVVNQSGYGFAEAVDSEPDFVDPRLTAPRSSYRGPRTGTGEGDIRPELMDRYRFDTGNHALLSAPDGTDLQLNSGANYARFNLVSLIERHRLSGSTAPLKAIILGCTHYPFHLETLRKVVREMREYESGGVFPYRDLLAEDLVFIDPAHYTAVECLDALREEGLLNKHAKQSLEAYISVPSADLPEECLTLDGGLTYAFKYGRETGSQEVSTKAVPFSERNLDPANLERIRNVLPRSYSLIEPGL
jgi:glutamate racemase